MKRRVITILLIVIAAAACGVEKKISAQTQANQPFTVNIGAASLDESKNFSATNGLGCPGQT